MSNKVAVVTGASGGIGSAIAKALDKNDYSIVLVYNSNESGASALHKALKNSIAIKCDVSSEKEVENMSRKAMEKMGKIDLLVNGASPSISYSRFAEKSLKDFNAHMNTNYFGAVNCIKNVLPHMIRQKSGNIVNILTQNVINPQPGFSDYISSKYALLGLTKCLALEYAAKNIRVNAVSPGLVETNMIKSLPIKAIEIAKETAPLGRLTTPEDVANAIIFLASDRASNITGINLLVCGGTTLM